MYVCVCHGLNSKDVKQAAGNGACCSAEVFRHFAVKPQCGRCVRTMQTLLREEAGCVSDAGCPAMDVPQILAAE